MAFATALRQEEPLTVEEILIEELAVYKEDGYSPRFSSVFWHAVFIRWYEEDPEGDNDKRWDELFKMGMPVLRKILGISDPVFYGDKK
jgi:hypothetical protein